MSDHSPEFRWAMASKLRFDAALLEHAACCAIGAPELVNRSAAIAAQALAIKLDADWQQARLAFGHPPPDPAPNMPAQPASVAQDAPNGSTGAEPALKRRARAAPSETA